MSYPTRDAAWAAGCEVLYKLKGKVKGAQLQVHENLGWHWNIKIGNLTLREFIFQSGEVEYSCLLSDGELSGTGESYWNSPEDKWFSDPYKAILFQLRIARRHVAKVTKVVEDLESRLTRKP